ncbi:MULTISPECIES: DMT family transporter [Citrobacter]|uniref:Threonine/homoserine exporter RhtA n=1 Tax=Citrobacter pasteurii TaxID=1563222 RepID=A0A6N6K0R8_9ENTR|nr:MULTISPECIES: DMT family transporter [Citrobacter]KAA1276488.1 DMT family transporter [Citrobacter pasteurii]QXA43782.1 DMT family transporter [Citrobacter pasteurii]TKU63618.1 DMT family transporter [Citrobacter sp. wls715]CEJ63701.1 Permease of the drug/metabolite transporter (DMT) superfamily [Citrobacter pasteurii]
MPYILLSLAACFWGGNYVVGHILVADVNPIVLSAARWIFTALVLMTLYFRQVAEQWPMMKKSFGTIAFLALCGQVLFPLTLYIGLQYTSSLNAAIYMSTTPAIVLLINKLFFKELISTRNIAGVILSTLGVIWLVSQGDLKHAQVLNHLNQGDLWTMGSALSWAVYCAFLRIKPRAVKGNAFVAVSALLGAIALIPVLGFELMRNGMPDWHHYANYEVITGLAYLIIFPSWFSYLLWNKGISAIGATRGEIYSHLIPLSGGFFSVVFLNVTLHSYHLVSALVIVCGITLCSRSTKYNAAQQPSV